MCLEGFDDERPSRSVRPTCCCPLRSRHDMPRVQRHTLEADGIELTYTPITADEGAGAEVTHTHGLKGVFEALNSFVTAGVRGFGVRDDWPFWHRHDEQGDAGKVLVFDPLDHSVHHMFFDDNLLSDCPRIVDARSLDGRELPYTETKDVFLLPVKPFDVMRSQEYFVNMVDSAETLRKARATTM